MKSHLLMTAAVLAVAASGALALAQAAAPAAPAPAAPAAAAPAPAAAAAPKQTVESLMATAKVAAGTEWGNVVMAVCIAPTPTAAPVAAATVTLAPAAPAAAAAAPASPPKDTWYAPPAKVADNFYFLGTRAHSAWALVASNGDMIILDNLF